MLLLNKKSNSVRPVVSHGINQDLAQDLGVLRWYPLGGNGYRDFKSNNVLSPTNVGLNGHVYGGSAPAFSSASYLDGNAVPELSATSNFTVMAWCATNVTSASGGGGGLRYIVSNEISGNWQFVLRYSPSVGFLQFGTLAGGGFVISGTTTVVANRPMCVIGQMVAGSIFLWLNGRQEATTGTGGTTSTNTTNIVTIGSDNGFNSRLRQWSGWISDVVIANKAWTAPQIALMSRPESWWSLYWQPRTRYFDLGSSLTGRLLISFRP